MSDDYPGFPMSETVDGMDTSKHPQGYQKNFGKILAEHTTYTNSKTGEKMDPPDYARED